MPKQVSKQATSQQEDIYDWEKLLRQENDDASFKVYDEEHFSDEEVCAFLEDAFDSDDDEREYAGMPSLELRK